MTIVDIADAIKKSDIKHTPIIIAIEGFGGSGKSTFAAQLKDALSDAYVVHIDDFFMPDKMSDANKSNFDRKRLEEQVLLPIKNGQEAHYQRLEEETNTLSQPVKIPEVKYLIIEGVSSFHPDIASYMDYKIWVNTPKEVAKERGNKRDKELDSITNELWEHWTQTYQEYKDLYHPEEAADFIFDNSR